jgi:uncharacterized protein YdhG (YjbR/CyaY superfamily)
MEPKPKFRNIDEYICIASKEAQPLLEGLRLTIHKAAPDAEEVISYQMPAFKQNGVLVFFAAWKDHIGFYPTSSGITAFKKELSKYKNSKGAVQFPLDKKLPLGLITKIVKYRVKENLAKKKKR